MDRVLWVVVFCSLLDIGLAIRQRCFDCTAVESPRDCNQITVCEHGEQCFIKKYVTVNGLVKFDLGCSSSARCRDLAGGRRRKNAINTCEECCVGEFCNNEGCGVTLPAVRGPMCFDCKTMDDPHLCRTVTLCPQGEGCTIHSDFLGSSYVYTSECIGLACDSLNNATLAHHKQCPLCCTQDYCNDHCRTT